MFVNLLPYLYLSLRILWAIPLLGILLAARKLDRNNVEN